MVDIDMWGEIKVKPNQHHMNIDLSYCEDKIIDYVEKQHPLNLQRIVENWKVLSYNLIKELNTNGIGLKLDIEFDKWNSSGKVCSIQIHSTTVE